MADVAQKADLTRPEIEAEVVSILLDMTQDWDLDLDSPIGASTRLMGDLAFESVDVVQFAVSIEQAFGKKGLPFEKLLMRDGDYVDDLEVSEVVAFLQANLSA